MQRLSLRIAIVVVTFFIGISGVSIWLFNRQTSSNTKTVVATNIENQIAPIDATPTSTIGEDYAVYSAILNDKYSNDVIVISDYTNASVNSVNVSNFNNKISILADDTVNDFKTKSIEKMKLENKFTFNGKLAFINEKDERVLFRADGWTRFKRKYPKVGAIIQFSRIGFNQEKTQALVEVAYSCGELCAGGDLLLLQKENDNWTIQQTICLWIS